MYVARLAGAVAGLATIGAAALVRREAGVRERLTRALLAQAGSATDRPVDDGELLEVPAPVARYFLYAFADRQLPIRSARLRQTGELRTSTTSPRWMPFTATQRVVPSAPGFVWDARVRAPLGMHVRVLDSYVAGAGAGRVSLLSTLAIGGAQGGMELNAGSLHRYLAEAPWYPTALLPQAGVSWSAIDDRSALATLSDHGTTVSLEFRFGRSGEVSGIFSPGRFRAVPGGFRQDAWEGRFGDYQVVQGMRVPRWGEVGWYEADGLQLVWKGTTVHAAYEFAFAPEEDGS